MANITWTSSPVTAKMKLPSGNVYYFKDADVRAWIGTGSSSGAEYRITELEDAIEKLSNATHWLGITSTSLTDGATTNPITIGGASVTAISGDIVQDSYGTEFIFNGTAWQQLGASIGTLKAFAFVDEGEVTITPKGTVPSGTVTFAAHTTDKVLGEDTTFTATGADVSFGTPTTATVLTSSVKATVPKPSGTKKYLTASASGGAVSVGTSASAITGLGTASTADIPNVTSAGTAASWSITVNGSDAEQLDISWTPNSPATLGTAITAVTGYASPTTDTFAKTVSMTTQPTVTLTSASSTSTGAVEYISALSTSGTNDVTFDTTTSGHTASAITALGTKTVTQPTITVGTNDKVSAITALGTATAPQRTLSGTEETYTVTPKSSS